MRRVDEGYMLFKLKPGHVADNWQMETLLNSPPVSVLKVYADEEFKATGEKELKNLLVSTEGLKSFFDCDLEIKNTKSLRQIGYQRLTAICDAALDAEDKLLSLHLRWLSAEYIYFDSGMRAKILCLPVLPRALEDSILRIKINHENLTERIEQSKNCDLIDFWAEKYAIEAKIARRFKVLLDNLQIHSLRNELIHLLNDERYRAGNFRENEFNADTKSRAGYEKFNLRYIETAARPDEHAPGDAYADIDRQTGGDKRNRTEGKRDSAKSSAAYSNLLKKKQKDLQPKRFFLKLKELLGSGGDFFAESEIEKTGEIPGLAAPAAPALLSERPPGTPEEDQGRKVWLLENEFVIGRDSLSCDFVLENNAVGRRHALISRHGDDWFIEDLGSKNGTLLNGRRLKKRESRLLPERCVLNFAGQIFYFSDEL